MSLYDKPLILGGHGMLARALTDALVSRGHAPVVLARAQCDLAHEISLQKAFADASPTLVFNCAAHTKVDQCEQEPDLANAVNGYAVGCLARLCRDINATLVHVSTDFVFDGSGTRPYRADDPVAPLSAYGRSKLLGETELQKHAPGNWLIVRTAWVFGRHGPNFPRAMVQAARAGKPLRVVSDQTGSPTYTVDLASGILELLDRNAHGVWHLTGGGTTTWFEFAKATLEAFGLPPVVEPITAADWQKIRPNTAARPKYSVLDVAPFAERTGHPPRHWRESLTAFRDEVEAAGGF